MSAETKNILSILMAFIAGVGLMVAVAMYVEVKTDNKLDEIATYIQMNEKEQAQYLIAKSLND